MGRFFGGKKGVVSNASAGSIVLMHVLYESRRPSIEALPMIIKGLREKGLEPTTFERLLSSGKPAEGKVARRIPTSF